MHNEMSNHSIRRVLGGMRMLANYLTGSFVLHRVIIVAQKMPCRDRGEDMRAEQTSACHTGLLLGEVY